MLVWVCLFLSVTHDMIAGARAHTHTHQDTDTHTYQDTDTPTPGHTHPLLFSHATMTTRSAVHT